MKHTGSLLFLMMLLAGYATGQNVATPNPGFENWNQVANYYNPAGWNNLNGNTAIVGVLTCTRASAPADVHSGVYAIKLTTKSVFGITANGIASTATLITTPPYGVTGGIPYTERPDSIIGWYKYNPASASDSGFVQFVLFGPANDTIGIAHFSTPNSSVSSYTRFSFPVIYFNNNTPVNSYWILSASDGVNPVVNSQLIVDDLDLVFNSTGLEEQANNINLTIINSVVENNLLVNNQSGKKAYIMLYNINGAIISTHPIDPGINSISIGGYNSGIYFFKMAGIENDKMISGKIIKL